jgi:hypothetical protein
MAEWLKAHAWKAALRLTRRASAKINSDNTFTSGCGVYHSQSVRPIPPAESFFFDAARMTPLSPANVLRDVVLPMLEKADSEPKIENSEILEKACRFRGHFFLNMRSQISPESRITFALHALLPRHAAQGTPCRVWVGAGRPSAGTLKNALLLGVPFSMSRFPQTFFPAFRQ